MTQTALADLVSKIYGKPVTQSAIQSLEKRDSNKSQYKEALAAALDVSEKWLETGREPKARLIDGSNMIVERLSPDEVAFEDAITEATRRCYRTNTRRQSTPAIHTEVLERLHMLATNDLLTEDDWILLDSLAKRLAQRS